MNRQTDRMMGYLALGAVLMAVVLAVRGIIWLVRG